MYGMPLKTRVRKMRARLSFDEYWGRLGYSSYHVWRLLHIKRRKWSMQLHATEEGLKK